MRLWRCCYRATVQCHSVLLSGREHAGDHLPGRRPQSRRGLAKNVGNLVSEFSIHRNAMNGISLPFGLNPAARRTSRAPRAAVSLPKKLCLNHVTPAVGALRGFSRRGCSTPSLRFGPDAANERNLADFREHGDGMGRVRGPAARTRCPGRPLCPEVSWEP